MRKVSRKPGYEGTGRVRKAIGAVVRRSQVRGSLRKLQRLDSWAAQHLAMSIANTIQHNVAPSEQAVIDRIEEKRLTMIDSDAQLLVTDYGAGDRSHRFDDQQMREGVVRHRAISELASRTSKPPFWGLLLFELVRTFEPATCVELGTCVGISAAYQASAQRLNGRGTLITLEGAESLAALARQNLKELGVENGHVVVGRFTDTLDGVLNAYQPIDCVFVDGHHDEMATVAYFEQIVPHLSPRSLMVFDDISWSPGMSRAWAHISENEQVKLSVDLGAIGLCAIDESLDSKHAFRIPVSAPRPSYVQ